jgi:hypothetical protein
MMRKNWLVKKRNCCSLLFELLLPMLFGGVLVLMNHNLACSDTNYPYETSQTPGFCDIPNVKRYIHYTSAQFVPMCLCLFMVIAFFFSGRYILTNVVADKENKMRETLRIMGLTQFNYALSFFSV